MWAGGRFITPIIVCRGEQNVIRGIMGRMVYRKGVSEFQSISENEKDRSIRSENMKSAAKTTQGVKKRVEGVNN